MRIALLVVEFRLHGASSLKDKRQRLGRIRDKFGKRANVAVHESGYQDVHNLSEWSFVIVAQSQKLVDQVLSELELTLSTELDAIIVRCDREVLY